MKTRAWIRLAWVMIAVAAANGLLFAADPPVTALRQLQNAFEAVAEQTSKSVVVITVTSKSAPAAPDGPDLENQPFDWWFEQPDRRWRIPTPRRQPRQPQQAQASGFVIRADGYILTNHHVIDGAEKIEVKFKEGKTYAAKLKGADPQTDVAVIKIDAENLPVAKLGDSDKVRVGQWAIAIGAPFHLDYSVTVGVISGKGRSVLGGVPNAYEDFLQTDASINPGNSGGPLVDIDGNVIGINTLIRANSGIGFAIPINLAKNGADKLIASGRIARPWLGISVAAPQEADELRSRLRGAPAGVVVKTIGSGTPADQGGVKPLDVISSVDGKKVTSLKELQQEIQKRQVGDAVAIEVWRDGKQLELKIKLAEMTEESIARSAPNRQPQPPAESLGIKVEEFTKEDAEKFGVPGLQGVRVAAIDPRGPAATVDDFDEGDVITEMDRQLIRSVEDFRAAAEKADLKRGVEIHFTKARTHVRTYCILRKTAD